MKAFIRQNWPYLALLSFLVFAVYLNTFDNAFVSDDKATFLEDPSINSFSYVLTRPFSFVRALLYWFGYQLFGPTPFPFRFINLIFHLGNVFLIFALLKTLSNRSVGIITALLFAVHPLLTEAVTWISGGAYSQAAFFMLLSFMFYIFRHIPNSLVWSLVSFFLALQTQAVAAIFPAILFLHELSQSKASINIKPIIPFIILSIIFFAISMLSVPERTQTLQTVHYQDQGIINPIISIPIIISSYLQLLFWPRDLTLYHSELTFTPITYAANVILTVLFLALVIYAFKKNKFIFFWLSFFLITLIPTIITSTFKLTWIVAERYVYLATLGILASVGWVFDSLMKKTKFKNLLMILIVIIIIGLSSVTILRNNDWQNEDSLWIATGKTSPSSPNTHNNLGDMYGRWGDKQKAIMEFKEAIRLKPDYADAYHNLANTYKEIGETDKALEYYQQAAKLNLYLWQSRQNIAAIYFERGMYSEALSMVEESIKISPQNPQLYSNLGIVYLKMGDKEKAKQAFQKALTLNPNNQLAKMGLLESSK